MVEQNWDLIRPSFLFLLNDKKDKNIVGVEVGTAEGKNALTMLKYYPNMFLHLVDTVDSEVRKERIREFEDRTTFICRKSVDAAKWFKDRHFDYVYIDGAHTYSEVSEDLIAWYPKCKIGGVMSGHDWWFGEVKLAVTHFFSGRRELLYAVQQFHSGTLPSVDAQMCDWWCKKE